MKTFGEVKVGDNIYTIDDDYRIKEIQISGIEDVRLAHQKVILRSTSGVEYTGDYNYGCKRMLASNGITVYSCIESARIAKDNMRNEYIEKQLRIAMQAFRRIKKATPNIKEQKKRVLNFFQILET